MAEININAFTGMNNVNPSFSVKKGVVAPRIVLNSDVDDSGKVNIRDGLTAYLALAGSHSLWACEECMICAADNVLYDISTGVAVSVSSINGPSSAPLDYAYVEGKIYVSNQYWNGIYNPANGTFAQWGISIPDQPVIIAADGNLPLGTYHVTMTNVVNGEISGNGPIAKITLSSGGGIRILNKPAGALIWATDQDGYTFSLVGSVGTIVDIPTIEPLPSFMCTPPLPLTNITYAFGRVWGARGNILYYSEPYQPGWFKFTSNRFLFTSEITVIAKVSSGLFVGMKDKTVFLSGVEPDQMTELSAGAGSIRGTLAYCNNLPELGDILGTPEKGYVDVPVWRTTEGIVAGNVTGKLYNLSKHKIKMGAPDIGASLYRQKNGIFQYLTSSSVGASGSGLGGYDAKLVEAVKRGRLTISSLSKITDMSVAGFSEDVSCEIRRGGVVIE